MFTHELFEARQDSSDIEYSEKKKKGEIERIIATLIRDKSGTFTRLAKRYKQIDRLLKSLKIKRNELNKEITAKVESLFDAEDEIYTRVVDTVSLTLTLSKQTTATYEEFDIEGYVEELEKLLPGYEQELAILREKYTKIDTVIKKPGLLVKVKKDKTQESINEDINSILGKLSAWAKGIYKNIMARLKKSDKRLNALKVKMSKDGLLTESYAYENHPDVYEEGKMASATNKLLSDNPYPYQSEKWWAWNTGFKDAEERYNNIKPLKEEFSNSDFIDDLKEYMESIADEDGNGMVYMFDVLRWVESNIDNYNDDYEPRFLGGIGKPKKEF